MNNQLYNDYTIFASISTDSMYYQYLSDCFGKENIYILNLSKANLMTFFAESLDKTKNNKIIFIPPSNKTFDINLVKKLKTHWDDEKLIIFNNKTPLKPVKHNIIGFNKNKININMLKKMKYNIVIQYLFNLYGSNIKKILLQDKEKISEFKEEKIVEEEEKTGISIIIPAYEVENFIEECLDSIQEQTYFKNNDKYEILLGIDECQDTFNKIKNINKKYPNLKTYVMDENSGPYIVKNTLIEFCKYDKILFFDADDVMCLDMIEKIINYNEDIIRFKFYNFHNTIKKFTKSKFDFAHGVFLANKRIFSTTKGFMPWKCGADTEFHERVKNFYKIKYLQDYIFYRRLHNKSLTNKKSTNKTSSIRKAYISKIKHIYTYNDLNINLVKSSFSILSSNPKTMLEQKFCKEYVKNPFVDYDAIIIIPSYNRFDKLSKLLTQLHKQKTKYKTKIIVYNDGSTDNRYKRLPEMYDINYSESSKNNNKHFYWKTINILLQLSDIYKSHAIIQIDDDFILCDNFIDNLMDNFFKSKEISNKNIAIHYHINTIREKYWGYDNGVDGGVLFDTNFLKEIGFKIDPIDMSRWYENPYLSSGVWHQITEKINKNNLLTYKINYSLVYHDGNEDSKMNTDLRQDNPLETLNYKGKLYE